jgi:general secretion pathway protein E
MRNIDNADPLLPVPRDPAFAERFAAFLIAHGLDEMTVQRARRAMRDSGERLDIVLTRLGLASEADTTRLLAEFLERPLIRAADMPETPLDLAGVDAAYLARVGVLPVRDDGEALLVAAADPFAFDADAAAALAFQVGRSVRVGIAAPADVARALRRLYVDTGMRPHAPAADGTSPAGDERASEDDVRRLADLASEAPIIRLVHDLIARAVEARASDIHIEQTDDGMLVRQRIDGLLQQPETIPAASSAAVVSRVKIMARLNIAERRLPQDGRVEANVRGREIDLRISTMPTLKGESVVMRILDRSTIALDFAALGFGGDLLARFLALLDEPNGLLLVTGPTGSGKSTTLYTALSRLNQPFRKTFTVEDPVEYQLAGVAQVQVQPRIGLDFATALRSILRQDPDVVMVGEIRDLETAEMAVQAALTGHLVLSTLHTNSAAATIARLIDMGVADYLIASTLKGILAQRLVRKLCPRCARPTEPSAALKACILRLDVAHPLRTRPIYGVREPVGCAHCRQTGFDGRTTVAELLVVDDAVAAAIVAGANERALVTAGDGAGMSSMLADGLAKVLAGITTLDEVLRVTRVS